MSPGRPLTDLIPVPAPGCTVGAEELLSAGAALGMPLDEMAACLQHPAYHGEGDVAAHTRLVVEALVSDPDYATLEMPERAEMVVTALFHDMAKPACTVTEGGQIRQPGHAHRGETMARVALWRAGVDHASRERIAQAIRWHLHPFWLLERADPTALVTEIAESLPPRRLALLARADATGRICADRARLRDAVDLFCEFAAEAGCLDGPYRFPSPAARFRYFQTVRHTDRPVTPAQRDYDPFVPPFAPRVFVTSGLPATGKDAYIARLSSEPSVISLDDVRTELGVKPTDNQGRVVAAAVERARQALRDGRCLVWNATNISRLIRAKPVDLAAAYGAQVTIWAFEAPETVLRARNAARTHPVPDPAIDRMLTRWQAPTTAECSELEFFAPPG